MAKTLDDLENLLSSNGFNCQRMLDAIVAITLPTKAYKNSLGQNALEILLSIDRPNDCVAVEILSAFDLRKTEHKEATLACLMTAAGRTPLLRPALEPEGDIRIRIDCQCDADGARDRDVLNALAILHSFVDLWSPQITSAMQKGRFDPNKVIPINLARMTPASPPAPAADPEDRGTVDSLDVDAAQSGAVEGGSGEADRESIVRAAKIYTKPGAQPHRLRCLLEFRRWLDQYGRGACDQN